MTNETSQRLERIEAGLAHVEHLVEQLNGVLLEQTKTVETMRRQLQRQAQTIETMELERIKANNAKPPHYQA
jgi:uncharacterized coiled-coil protein SlyX